MPDAGRSILTRWSLTEDELTELVDQNPSLRGILLGYAAEMKLRKAWFSGKGISVRKDDDHDRKHKGDLVIRYKRENFRVESKSLQTAKSRREGEKWVGYA